MVIVAENNGGTVLLYRTASAYENGRNPIDWTHTGDSDKGINDLGYERVSDWSRTVYGTMFATVRKIHPSRKVTS